MINLGYIEIKISTIIMIVILIVIAIIAGIALYKIRKKDKLEKKEIKKNDKKVLCTIIGIIINSLILIGINIMFYSDDAIIRLAEYKRNLQIQHLATNFIWSLVLTAIYSYIVFNKKDLEKKEIWKSIICMALLIIIPAIITFFLLYN